jgi:hypothetical protein
MEPQPPGTSVISFEKKGTDPLLHRNFGLMIEATGMSNLSDTVLASNKPAKNFQLNIFPHTETGSVAEWKQSLFDMQKTLRLYLQAQEKQRIKPGGSNFGTALIYSLLQRIRLTGSQLKP